MRYANVVRGTFLSRTNRFIAHVLIDGKDETVHVKNTGRCRELLVPGSEVYLAGADRAQRKTRYDLISVRKSNGALFNIDSQAPNRVTAEWLKTQGFDSVIPEYSFGKSRIDFCLAAGGRRLLLEVKGCTLERGGVGYFPDAPTERGTKHLTELTAAVRQGLRAAIAFVIQTDGVTEVRANTEQDPAFAQALEQARNAGVLVRCLSCHVEPDAIRIRPENLALRDELCSD